jgi:hypothetical protein
MTWMPAHTKAAEMQRVKSNGTPVSTAEWRANQLADILAKKGARSSNLRDSSDKMIRRATCAMRQSAATLGIVTLAANNHVTQRLRGDGSTYSHIARDSSQMPKVERAKKTITAEQREAKLSSASIAPPAAVLLAQPLMEPSVQQRLLSRKRKAREAQLAADTQRELAATNAAVLEAAARSRPPPISAADLMARLRARVVARAHLAPT